MTWSGILYVAASGVFVYGLITRRSRRARKLVVGSLGALALIGLARTFAAADGSRLHMEDGASSSRLVGRLVDEADIALTGTRVLTATHLLRDDANELPSAMKRAYVAMRADEGDAPSPVVATYLGFQDRDRFDLVVIDPPERTHANTALVFLHGFAGNFALPCWQMARAVAPIGIVTACPSTSWLGQWWTDDGQAILQRTIATLRARGIDHIVLAGLSNGAIGASMLAARMRGAFTGLILISGVEPDAPPPGIPTLVIHGTHDSMTSFAESRAYASRASARFVALDAGHFAMLVRSRENDRAVLDFVRARVSGTSGPCRSPSPSGSPG